MMLAIVDDLILRSKLEAAAERLGVPLLVSAGAAPFLPPPQGSWRLAIVDLHLSSGDPLGVVRALRQAPANGSHQPGQAAPPLTIIGVCAHVQHELRTKALAAGCTEVLPRSAFVQRLPTLFAEADGASWESRLTAQLAREGLAATRWSNGPHAVYGAHDHLYGKVLYVVSGSITFTIEGARARTVPMQPGDRLDLPAHTPHGAVVGPDGVVCLEAHIQTMHA